MFFFFFFWGEGEENWEDEKGKDIESSTARTKVKDMVPSETKDGWRKPRLAVAGAQP